MYTERNEMNVFTLIFHVCRISGENGVHRKKAAMAAMRKADLVVVWGSQLGVFAQSYADPWNPDSEWYKVRYHITTI